MFQIVKANIDHAQIIAELGEKTFLASHGNSALAKDINSFISKTYCKEAIAKDFERTNILYHLIYYHGQVAGFSSIVLNTPCKDTKDLNVTKLDRIYLLEEVQGKYLGSKLLNFNIQLSKNYRQQGIWLAVWVENHKAINFYTKSGFKIIGAYDFSISPSHTNPNHIMYLKY